MLKYVIIFAILILAWCPWLSALEATQLIDARVAQMQKQNPNLCAMSVNKNSIRKVPFGYTEQVSYDCAVSDPIYGVWNSTNIVFITFYKGLLGMPNKSVARDQ